MTFSYWIVFIGCLVGYSAKSNTIHLNIKDDEESIVLISTSTKFQFEISNELNKPNPIFNSFKKKKIRLNKKITAAALAFPFPFGIVGLHRIYLGTKPHVPVVYIATLGGVFGLLPLVDFFVIIADKDFEQYKNNGKIFMWIKE